MVPDELGTVAAELDRVIGAALRRTPCVISFSGGRDSSALLAWAVQLARRDGHDLPIPATLIIPGDSAADESAWQHTVLAHLGITERWEFTVSDELDAVGPVATAALRRHGVLWPFNTHMHLPIIAAARGGAVITGFGGDELGRSSQFARAAQTLTGRRGVHLPDALIVGLALSPAPVQRAVFARRNKAELAAMPWLTADARQQLSAGLAADEATVPLSWARTLRTWFGSQRYFEVCQASFAALGSAYDVAVTHPFVAPGVRHALAAQGGFAGLGNRESLMRVLFGDVLPREIIERRSKASFSNVLWTDTAREFARDWSGQGLDESLVDVAALRRHWSGDADMRSLALLQTAWLHDDTGR